ncbi:MAG: hypothetical protein N2324_11760 [Thermus sp.]|nr:hypothetical protein [Thermus sp.]MCX7850830.1 hypothetical protein [Thermus sp.]
MSLGRSLGKLNGLKAARRRTTRPLGLIGFLGLILGVPGVGTPAYLLLIRPAVPVGVLERRHRGRAAIGVRRVSTPAYLLLIRPAIPVCVPEGRSPSRAAIGVQGVSAPAYLFHIRPTVPIGVLRGRSSGRAAIRVPGVRAPAYLLLIRPAIPVSVLKGRCWSRAAIRVPGVRAPAYLLLVRPAVPVSIGSRGHRRTALRTGRGIIGVSAHLDLFPRGVAVPIRVSLRVRVSRRVIDEVRPVNPPAVSLMPLYRVRPAVSVSVYIGTSERVIRPLVRVRSRVQTNTRERRGRRTYRGIVNIGENHLVPESIDSSLPIRGRE